MAEQVKIQVVVDEALFHYVSWDAQRYGLSLAAALRRLALIGQACQEDDERAQSIHEEQNHGR